MAERNSLLNCRTGNGTAGSNPALSAQKTAFRASESGFYIKGDKIPPKVPPKFGTGKLFRNMGKKPKYKEPKIVRAKRGWFIALYYLQPDESGYKRFELSGGINYIHDVEQKEKEIQDMLKYLVQELKNGFNPFFPDLESEYKNAVEIKKNNIVNAESLSNFWVVSTALDNFSEDCRSRNLAPKTIKTYESFIKNLRLWFESYEHEPKACEITVTELIEFLETSFNEEEWSPRTYNNHVKFISTLFSRLSKIEKRINPDVSYKLDISEIDLKKDRAEKNRYYSPSVAEKVKKELEKDPDLYNYIKWVYYSCMRPREISLLKIQHIDMTARQIKAIGPTAKTGDRFIPICDELFELIKSMKLHKLPLNFYVFGKYCKPFETVGSDRAVTKRYMEIKNKLDLDDKYTVYGWKHTRVVNLLMAGFTDQQVMSLTGHRDFKGFLAYKRDLVIDSSIMKGKTITL